MGQFLGWGWVFIGDGDGIDMIQGYETALQTQTQNGLRIISSIFDRKTSTIDISPNVKEVRLDCCLISLFIIYFL